MSRKQHKTEREASKRQLADLKKENTQLKRQVARLRKELGQLNDPEPQQEPETQVFVKPKCPKCNSTNLGAFTTPSGKVKMACKACRVWKE